MTRFLAPNKGEDAPGPKKTALGPAVARRSDDIPSAMVEKGGLGEVQRVGLRWSRT